MRNLQVLDSPEPDGQGRASDGEAAPSELRAGPQGVGVLPAAVNLPKAPGRIAGGGQGAGKVARKVSELERVRLRCVCDGDCWLWSGSLNSKGLPTISRPIDGEAKTISARRWVLMTMGEELSPRDVVAVTCENPTCLNPKHLKKTTLRAVQIEANQKDPGLRAKRGRSIRLKWMEKGMGLKLTKEQADYARSCGLPSKQVAQELGVSPSLVNYIRRGHIWKDHTNPFSGLGA